MYYDYYEANREVLFFLFKKFSRWFIFIYLFKQLLGRSEKEEKVANQALLSWEWDYAGST